MPAKLALPLAMLMACVTSDDAGVIEQEIVGGTSVSTTDFPTVVALQHGAGNWFCTGVLVDKDWVLTSASCFGDTSATQVRIGDANLGDGTTSGQTITVSNIYKHPQFSTTDAVWRHDVAVLKLATSVTDRTPSAIRRTATAVGTAITQAGFGQNNNNGGGGGQLRSLATTNIDCAGAGDSGITNANLLCFNAGDGTGSCYGDGGAPSFVAGAVAGVASGGTGNSCTSGLDIYTSLVPELSFIDQHVPFATTPPPTTPPTTPPPNNPDGSGSGSGSGGARDPDDDGKRGPARASCSAGGEAGWLAAFGVALGAMLRRRRR
ncbi:MAG: DUF1986 domain-containing protein [Myxococcota bacterium]|nr:DUF1986 domain-containing protein [Myxococcota bacterium]